MVLQETEALSVLEEPALLARHTAAIKLLRQGREVDGMLLLSYVVWPSPDLDAAHAVAESRSASTPEGWRAVTPAVPPAQIDAPAGHILEPPCV